MSTFTSSETKQETFSGVAAIEKFRELVDGIHIAMLVTSDPYQQVMDGRPMGTQDIQDDGSIWFFTQRDTAKVSEIVTESHVAVSYADTKKNSYVFARGDATIVEDHAKATELWNPMMQAWFDSPEDPELVLIRVHVDSAEYWTSAGGRAVSLMRIGAKALGADKVSEGDMGHLEM
jgi:general stress protein 26